MNKINVLLLSAVALVSAVACAQQSTASDGTGVRRTEENNWPQLFAPGIVSGAADDLSPAFSPDGKEVYFTRRNRSGGMILVSRLVAGTWSEPQIASFSGEWNDLEPTMAPDGSFLVFASNRPIAVGGKAIDGNYNGQNVPAGGGNLWRVNRKNNAWGDPYRLPTTINQGTATFSPSVTADGSIYFMQPDPKTGYFHLYRSQHQGDTYLPAIRVEVGTDQSEDVDPAVSPDERYLVYSSNQPADHSAKLRKIAFHRENGWSVSQDLGDKVNEQGNNIEARLSSDGKTLYFSTNTVPLASYPRSADDAKRSLAFMEVWANGSENIWFVSLSPWIHSDQKQSRTVPRAGMP
jgi:Tol biopolymer transport system component